MKNHRVMGIDILVTKWKPFEEVFKSKTTMGQPTQNINPLRIIKLYQQSHLQTFVMDSLILLLDLLYWNFNMALADFHGWWLKSEDNLNSKRELT
jgi:hypothetical protein